MDHITALKFKTQLKGMCIHSPPVHEMNELLQRQTTYIKLFLFLLKECASQKDLRNPASESVSVCFEGVFCFVLFCSIFSHTHNADSHYSNMFVLLKKAFYYFFA